MEYSALVRPGRPSRVAPGLLLGVACGLLVWLVAAPAAPRVTEAHVTAAPALRSSRPVLQGRPVPNPQATGTLAVPAATSAAAAPSRSTFSVLRAVGLEGSSGSDVVSIAAIIVSLWAATISLLRSRPAEPEAPAPSTYTAAPSLPALPASEGPQQMEDAIQSVKADLESRKIVTPKQAILELQAGNGRFWSGTPRRPELNAMERRALIIAQAPTVCILSCADSRVPVELVFDQGLGSIFVVRVAGNILDATALGSIEFSVKYLGVKVVLVMGHEGCGAVKGAMTMSPQDLDQQPAFLKEVLVSIKGNLNVPQLSRIQDSRAQDREAVITNCSSQVKKLLENKLIEERVSNGSLLVAGAFYEITSGIVDFFTLDKNGLVTDI